MIRRFRLEQKSLYEKLVIAQRLSDMLEKFLDGRRAPLEIGAEQGGIEEWDDVVIVHSRDSFEHLQIKRQSTPFCTKDPDMRVYLAKLAEKRLAREKSKAAKAAKAAKGGKAASVPLVTEKPVTDKPIATDDDIGADEAVATLVAVDDPANADDAADAAKDSLSVLDSAFSSLARHARAGTFAQLPERRFQLTLLGAHLSIKDKLTVNHLDELCKLCRQIGLNPDDLAKRVDGPTTRAHLWLTTWCGFEDWTQIIDTLKRVTVVCVGNDATLQQRSVESLGRHFTNPERALEQLISVITAEVSDVSALGCHAIIHELRDELRPDIETWAQYLLGDEVQPSGKTWSFSGTHDLGALSPRTAQGVVNHLWGSAPGNRKLRVYAPYSPPIGANLTLPSAILRMALHLPHGSQSLMQGAQTWRTNVGHEVGHTLGCAESDLKDLSWMDNTEALVSSLDHEFKTLSAARAEAVALASAMDDLVWQRLTQSVSAKLNAVKDSDLADAMEAIWLEWLDGFTKNPESRRQFLEQLLYPETEGKNASHALRLGPRTVDLLVSAVELLLLVAVGVGGAGTAWKHFPEFGEVLSIALKYWSGPATGAPEVREISDDLLINVIGPSPAPVVILSGVSTPPSELLNTGMADDAESATSMAAERRPHLLVTRSGVFNQLRFGTLATVRQHFSKQLQDRLVARQSAIDTNTKGI
ncbi:ABC-three component system protein [Pseudomonas sp. RGM 3321]|uniref:ABC-three component system protein n=1 Tax=Pseudomonas sp. RGM 3321 TaxID=2930089 RepID=UPI001FCB4B8A|nr:ABC-three component system protein [Pseudomonas sp. RGM 3321]MCJ2370766.1 hypothetical protein [Pseudomonas sp. RGM 3321]